MWNGSAEKSLGKTQIKVYNPKTKETFAVNFDVVLGKHTPILRSTAAQKMNLITMNTGNYEIVAAVQPILTSREQYFEKYPEVLKALLGKLEGTVSLQLNQDVAPSALPGRQVLIALRQPMKKELLRLQEFGCYNSCCEAN